MSHRLRYPWLQLLRTGMLLVFALGLLAQPVLSALGELHELTVHADSARGHTGHNVPHEHASTTQADERDTGGPMHELLHYAHCCGHTVGLAGADLPLPSFHWPTAHPVDAKTGPIVVSHASTPFRPPISA